ncbi:ABC transporter ATP-binding protein [Halobellus ruber]|uniref:ABC transporter ATP-binding protein n=1 Tax=Halobellus ruber TaxID=2761102 RepID=A0A7J9SJA6_9EURY|nr:ABC transporter ATP-binding protein [Halobellus ruber]MBB6646622.1 ABC transporter ATP-binding protein [Halobellus ruber]
MTATTREKLGAVREVIQFRPGLEAVIVVLSLGTALLEGVGVGFILPIVEVAQSSGSLSEADGILRVFVRAYSVLGVPFTLETLIIGIAGVMTVRFGLSFLTAWLRAILGFEYQRELRQQLYEALLYGPVEYIDRSGSDDLLNSIITETVMAASVVTSMVRIANITLRGLIYLGIATYLSPRLTAVAVVTLGLSTGLVRYVIEPAYDVGEEIASVNDTVQTIAQAGIQGIHDVRLFNRESRFADRMRSALDKRVSVGARMKRNEAALGNVNQLLNALVIFGLVYAAFRFTPLSLAEISVFLFAVFRLSPVINQINTAVYTLDGQLPHLIRIRSKVQELDELRSAAETGSEPVSSVERVAFDDVSFAYDDDQVLDGVSFEVARGEKIAFVGPSGAGKSTIVSLLGRLRSPDAGRIRADGTPIDAFDVEQWRERVAVVRQDPFLFDDTLEANVKVGNQDASRRDVEWACRIARVTEFLPELPDGYETELGENGVRLSGGQRQRVAIARAVLKDADVLVLDEATSDLDSNIEQEVYRGLRDLEGQRATIAIAHDLSTVSDADRIYTLVDGSITEVGTHSQLLERDGTYADLYATQT